MSVRTLALVATCVSLCCLPLPPGLPAAAQPAANGATIVAAVREARERMSLDARARLTTITPAGRSVVRLRIRARSFDGVYKSLVELTDSDEIGRLLLIEGGSGLDLTAWRAARGEAPHRDTVPPTGRLSWLSACASIEDLSDAYLWWSWHELTGEERVDSRQAYLVVSRPASTADTAYREVRSWIDRERLVPLRVERTLAEGAVTTSTTVRVRKRDGHWLPERVVQEANDCRTEMTVVGGTTRAKLDASIFDVVG